MTFRQFAAIVEIRTKIVSVSTFALATAYAYWAAGVFPAHLVVLTFLAALAVDMGTTGFNTFFDYLQGVDHIDYNRESAKVLVHEGVSALDAFLVSAACFVGGGIFGLVIAIFAGWEILIAGALCAAVGFFYSGGPFPLSRTPAGEIFAGGFLGTVFFLIIYYIYTGTVTVDSFLVSIPSTVIIASILTTNNTCDFEGDARARRRTLAIVLGRRVSAHLVWIQGGLAMSFTGLLAVTGTLPIWCGILQVPVVVLSTLEYRRMFRRGFSHETKAESMGSVSRVFLMFSAAVFAGLVVSSFSSNLFTEIEVDNETYTERRELHLGTVVTIRLFGHGVDETIEDGFDLVSEYEDLLSRSVSGSAVARINAQAGSSAVTVSEKTIEVILEGIRYGELSGGLFDISIGPLVDLWGIGTGDARVPSEQEIESAVELVDYRRIAVEDDGSVMLQTPGMKLDLGGIAKGYIADRLEELFLSRGIESGLVNLGGNILTIGRKPEGDPFRIAIQHPDAEKGDFVGVIPVVGESVVSSGVYERYFIEDGRRYHHILNPDTGYPVENGLLSVSIISGRSVDADGLSTAVFCLGLERGMDLVEQLEGIECVVIDSENRIYLSSALEGRFELTNEAFELVSN